MIHALLIGSGACAEQARAWNLQGWIVGAINNAWSIPSELHAHVRSGDWIPAQGNRPPLELYQQASRVTHTTYDGPRQHQLFGRQSVGIGATMLWNAAYWMLGEYRPTDIAFVGCSMDYPDGDANTFYGAGSPDPLRFPLETLKTWYDRFEQNARKMGCRCWNVGSPGLCPYARRDWESFSPASGQ